MLLGPEFRWEIDGYTPETIPMTRLGEYMQQLGKLLGHEQSIHFVRIEKSSVALISQANGPIDAGKSEARVVAVRRGEGVVEAVRAYETLNEMLAEDGTAAKLYKGRAVIIRFPGRRQESERSLEIDDAGSVVGYLYMLYQHQDGFRARLRLDLGSTLQCSCSEEALGDLKQYLFGTVRVHGHGRWARSSEGTWSPLMFRIDRVQRINRAPLRDVIDSLRDIDIEWTDDPLGYLANLDEVNGTVQ